MKSDPASESEPFSLPASSRSEESISEDDPLEEPLELVVVVSLKECFLTLGGMGSMSSSESLEIV